MVRQLAPFNRAEYWPRSIAFSPSAPFLATFGERDRVVRLWSFRLRPVSDIKHVSLTAVNNLAQTAPLAELALTILRQKKARSKTDLAALATIHCDDTCNRAACPLRVLGEGAYVKMRIDGFHINIMLASIGSFFVRFRNSQKASEVHEARV